MFKPATLVQAASMTEDQARELLEALRWPDGIICPKCGGHVCTRLKGKAHRPGVIKCYTCRKQFTVTVGTIMHRSHIPLKHWVLAFYSICAHKKGLSALQLRRDLGLGTYRSAWHLAHRIREAMRYDPLAGLFKGVIEADETYVGGKSRNGWPGRGSERKTPVMLVLEREGRAVSMPIERVNAATLKGAIREYVDPLAAIYTDEWRAYHGIGKEFEGGHHTVNHLKGEYSRGGVNTNSAESYFALLKRGVYGTFHSVSKKHLGRYCHEFSHRWNHRKTTDGERAAEAMKGIAGKRLEYRTLIGKPKAGQE